MILTLVCLCGCQYANYPANRPETQENSSEIVLSDEQTTINDDNADKVEFMTIRSNDKIESASGLSSKDTMDFGHSTFEDVSVLETKSISLLGKEYELYYIESVKLPKTATTVHVYGINGEKSARVLFDEKNNNVVEYSNIPIKILYESEQEYVDFIYAMVKDRVDLADYDYQCTTWHYIYHDNGIEKTIKDGFYKCSENEELSAYNFYFSRFIYGVKTLDHISAAFFNDSFSIEIYDLEYNEEMFSNFTPEIRNEICDEDSTHLNYHLLPDHSIEEFRIVDQTLFIRDGHQYCETIVNVDISHNDLGTVTTRQRIISGWFPIE